MHLTVLDFTVLTISTLTGVLSGIFIYVSVTKEKIKHAKRITTIEEQHEEQIEEQPTSKYTEGKILKQKLERTGVSFFDLGCAAEDVDPADKVKVKQSGEDNSYEILKRSK